MGRIKTSLTVAATALWDVGSISNAHTVDSAQQPASAAEFMIGAQRFRATYPAGFCLGTPQQLKNMQALDQADPLSDTIALAVPCPDGDSKEQNVYAVFKTPRQLVDSSVPLTQVIEGFSSGTVSDGDLAAYAKENGKQVSEITREKTDMDLAIKPMGKDARCGYMGGAVTIIKETATYHATVGICATGSSNKVILVSVYGPAGGAEEVEKRLKTAANFADGLKPISD